MTVPPEKLPEEEFIQNQGIPFWVWIFIIALICGLFLQFFVWYWQGDQTIQQPPFYRVTNRQMSVFLWQNPGLMRKKAQSKRRYLPAFDSHDQVALNVESADQAVIAPPDLLFRYHTWNRLLKDEFINTPIPVDAFLKFLSYSQEWLPANWKDAPKQYRELIPELPKRSGINLANLSKDVLPQTVRIAFQGWHNYFDQADQIKNTRPTYGQMMQFLKDHPDYSRNYWRNLFPQYLYAMSLVSVNPDKTIPESELPPFLKQAYFNSK